MAASNRVMRGVWIAPIEGMASLETYRKKRDFAKTREPEGAVAKKKKGFSFVVQKHAASRLHYDFRLELDGVLLSWAVPKGPSLDPSVKRLAMQTEDHPIAYREFEGVIPKGEYGGGTVMVWDTGHWRPDGDPRAAYEKGHLAFDLDGEKLRGRWHLVRTRKRDEDSGRPWLFFKGDDDEAHPEDPDITERLTKSAISDREMDEIAADGDRVWHSNRSAEENVRAQEAAKRSKVAERSKVAKRSKIAKRSKVAKRSQVSELAGMVRDLAPSVRFSNLDKVLYTESGITKGALAAYYALVADAILPHMRGRPLTFVRCPDGPDGNCFFQKHVKVGVPASIKKIAITEEDGEQATYLMVDDRAGLLGAVQLGSLELHVWGSREGALETPDQLVFDLDPGPGVGWDSVVEGAMEMRALLETHGLESWVKTTGGKGLHVVAPVQPKTPWDVAKAFTKMLAETLEANAPDRFTANMAKAKRNEKIFVDYLRNGRGATAITPYSTRARAGATVATPLTWKELEKGVDPAKLDILTVPERLRSQKADPWAGFFEVKQSIPAAKKTKKK